jgi:hypothetical protein
MLAIVLTGLVVMVAYAAAQVAFDARARLAASLDRVEGSNAVRALLRDALRNARAAERSGDPGFALAHDTLSFVAGGGAGPLDPDYDWWITVAPDARGLAFAAVPLGHARAARIAFRWPDVTRWQVRALGVGESQWRADWGTPTITPQAVSIAFASDSGPSGPPLRVVLWAGTPALTRDSPRDRE